MVVRLHEVVDREVVLSIIEAGTTPNDLFEFDHRIHWTQQHDVADIPGINTGR